MPLLTPDPTFYPSPTMATLTPPEKLAYVALINPRPGGADAIGGRRAHAGLPYGHDAGRVLGLNLLRKAWFNLDWAWAGALVVTGLVVLLK
jgi:hypothetical protein